MLWGGVSSKTGGTLSIGRQQSLQLDALAVVRPANSLLLVLVSRLFGLQRRRGQYRGGTLGQLGQVCVLLRPCPCVWPCTGTAVRIPVLIGKSYGVDVGVTFQRTVRRRRL